MASRSCSPGPALPRCHDVLEEIFLRVASPASSPARLSSAATAPSTRRYCLASSTEMASTLSRRPIPLRLSPVVSSPGPSTCPSFLVVRNLGRCMMSAMGVSSSGCWHRRCYCRRFTEDWDITVCDPVFRRYLLLPRITDDLLASVGLDNIQMLNSGASLIPSRRGTEEETSFSVICWTFSKTRLAIFIFSSTSPAHWAAVKSISWADLGLPEEVDCCLNCPGQCVYGCFYWKLYCRNELLKLDMGTMEFSKYDLPPAHHQRSIVIVESGEGKVAMFSILREGPLECYTFVQHGSDKSHKWCLKSTIPLPVHGPSNCFIAGHAEGYVFLTYIIEEQDKTYLEYFSLEVESCKIERACRTNGRILYKPYFGFPPSLSPMRIQEHGED